MGRIYANRYKSLKKEGGKSGKFIPIILPNKQDTFTKTEWTIYNRNIE